LQVSLLAIAMGNVNEFSHGSQTTVITSKSNHSDHYERSHFTSARYT
jgi:hypothetical protein